MKISPLQLNNVNVTALTLATHESGGPFSESINVTTKQGFQRGGEKNNEWLVHLEVVFKSGDDKPAKHTGSIAVVGAFTVVGEPQEEHHLKLVAVSCPTMLYSTAREMVAMITGRGPHGQFLLPAVSFTDHALKSKDEVTAATKSS